MIAILARCPTKGRCKTRLIPKLGAAGAARLQAWLIADTVRRMRATGEPLTIWATPRTNHGRFLRLRRQGLQVRQQRRGDLGQKMQQAIACGGRREPAIVVGTDCPALTSQHLQQLWHSRQPTVIPAEDGGYVALYMPTSQPRALAAMSWGSAKVLRQTQRNFRRCGGGRLLRPALPDLDQPRDFLAQRRMGLIPAQALWQRST